MPAGFRRHLVGKTPVNVFTVILLKYASLASDHTDIFINERIECNLNNANKSSPLNSTHYATLYQQNGDRIVTIDSVTSLGDRAFPVTAARAWNALPSSVRSAPSSLLQFRRDLKTALHVSLIVLFTVVSSCVTDCNF